MKPITLHDYKRRMLRVLVHVQEHLDEPLAVDDLAAIACFSPFHFHRVFRGMVGESVKEYVRRLRLERAAARLRRSGAPVTQIALDAGYRSHEAFTRAFTAWFGASPSGFRSARRPGQRQVASGLHYRSGHVVTGFRAHNAGASMKVEIKRVSPIRVAFVRHVGPYPEVGAAWDRLLPALGQQGLLGGTAMFIGVCHDDPEVTPPAKLRYDACVTVDERFDGDGDIAVRTIAGGDYAITTHVGPYATLGDTYAQLLGRWLPRSGRELRETPCFEVYLNSPESTAPDDLVTDIYAPLT